MSRKLTIEDIEEYLKINEIDDLKMSNIARDRIPSFPEDFALSDLLYEFFFIYHDRFNKEFKEIMDIQFKTANKQLENCTPDDDYYLCTQGLVDGYNVVQSIINKIG